MTVEAKLYEALKLASASTIEELARELRVSKTAIRRALAKLEEDGCIAVTQQNE